MYIFICSTLFIYKEKYMIITDKFDYYYQIKLFYQLFNDGNESKEKLKLIFDSIKNFENDYGLISEMSPTKKDFNFDN